jgi:hypothetical protein
MNDAFPMAVTQDTKYLLHYVGCAFLWNRSLVLYDWGEGLAKAQLHDNKIAMTVLKKFINFIHKGMINLFQSIDLLL